MWICGYSGITTPTTFKPRPWYLEHPISVVPKDNVFADAVCPVRVRFFAAEKEMDQPIHHLPTMRGRGERHELDGRTFVIVANEGLCGFRPIGQGCKV